MKKQLSEENFKRAQLFIERRSGRLEDALFGYIFGNGKTKTVISVLTAGQDSDGSLNLGRPDNFAGDKMENTLEGLFWLRFVKYHSNDTMVTDAAKYLFNAAVGRELLDLDEINTNRVRLGRRATIGFNGCRELGIIAEAADHFLEYATLFPPNLGASILNETIFQLDRKRKQICRECFCSFARLLESPFLNRECYDWILQILVSVIDKIEAKRIQRYSTTPSPLIAINNRNSPFINIFHDKIDFYLNALVDSQQEEGCWSADLFFRGAGLQTDVMKGKATLNALHILHEFGRIEHQLAII